MFFAWMLLVPLVKYVDLTGRFLVAALTYTAAFSAFDIVWLAVDNTWLHTSLLVGGRFVLSALYFWALDTIAEGFWWWMVLLFCGAGLGWV